MHQCQKCSVLVQLYKNDVTQFRITFKIASFYSELGESACIIYPGHDFYF